MNSRRASYEIKIPAEDFNLEQTLDCGQCFRWDRQGNGSYQGVAFGKKLLLVQDGSSILLLGASPEEFRDIWVPYFDLDFPYGEVREQLLSLIHISMSGIGTTVGFPLIY